MIKVLINYPNPTSDYLKGGVSNYINILKSHFVYDVDYFIIGSRVTKEFLLYRIIRLISDYLHFIKILINNKYDVVHLNPSLRSKAVLRDGIFILIIKLFSNAKIVVFFHGWERKFWNLICKRYNFLFKGIFHKTDSIIVLSNEYKNLLIQNGYKKNIFLGSAAIDDNYMTNLQGQKKYNMNKKKNILFLSRFEKEKGIYIILDLIKIINKESNDFIFRLVGKGPEYYNFKTKIDELKFQNVHLMGHVNDKLKQNVFMQSDIFLFPTYYPEGMPACILEAMFFGLSVITRNVGAMNDFFIHNKMGYMTSSKDPDIFLELLNNSIRENKFIEMGEYNRKYAKNNFLASMVAGKIEKIYAEVLL